MPKPIKILFISSEVAPFAKVGGLADVVGSLPIQLREFGVDARVIAPRYESVRLRELGAKKIATFNAEFGKQKPVVSIYEARLPKSKVPVYLLEERNFLSKTPIYEAIKSRRNWLTERFLFLCKAALEASKKIRFNPHIIHVHDWPTAPLCIMLAGAQKDPFFADAKSLLTIHNIHYQNSANLESIKKSGMSAREFSSITQSKTDPRYFNLLAQSLLSASAVNTVSPTYAKEIYQPAYGAGLQVFLKMRKDRVWGILNGIDTEYFNPAKDKFLATSFGANSISKRLLNKRALQESLDLEVNDSILLCGMVTRLDEQKGIELVIKAMKRLLPNCPYQFVVLGVGEEKYRNIILAIQKKNPSRVSFTDRYDSHLAKQIYAGADLFLMPSKFEPCGLAQLIAMRYGSLPLVHDTGGLHDTVVDYRNRGGDGFVFEKYSFPAFFSALKNAYRLFQKPAAWKKLQTQAMRTDYSWNRSAKVYLQLYKKMLKKLA
ncbi:MAG: glycogen/starch synthase [bacterium]|nr:glycogen/starch synthase [bacterium]